MFRNYLKITVRNFLRYKAFTFINLFSLSIGVVCCLVIGLFVVDELKFDKFIPDHHRIYRVYNESQNNQQTVQWAVVPPMYATSMQQQFPQVEKTLRIMVGVGTSNKKLFEFGNIQSYEEKGIAAENSFFDFFPLPVSGEPSKALSAPNTIVLTSAIAKKLFGNTDPLGKTIQVDKVPFKITGVFQKLPEHFHLDFNFIYSLASNEVSPERMESWTWNQFYTYVKLKEGTNLPSLKARFTEYATTKAAPFNTTGSLTIPHFQQLADIHLLSSSLQFDDHVKKGNMAYVQGLSIIGLFILFIACFNFVNLSTARSTRRAKEVGVRKAIGAEKKQLIIQFLGESVFLCILSILIASGLVMLLLNTLNHFTGKSIHFNPFTSLPMAVVLLAGGVILGTLAGLYPAVFLSGMKAIQVMKNNAGNAGKVRHAWLRKGLVVVQFTLSAILIICTLVVYNQMTFLHTKDLGFNKDQVILLQLRGGLSEKADLFKTELMKSPHVVSATAGYGFPGDMLAGDGITVPEENKEYSVNQLLVDFDYAKTLALTFVAGRDFSKEMKTDPQEAFIINESAVTSLGFGSPEKAVGRRLNWNTWFGDDSVKRGKVIGVVKDIHLTSLHEKVKPTVIQIFPASFQMAIKLKSDNIKAALDDVDNNWNKLNKEYPFEYKFLDDNFNRLYQAEDKLSTLLWIFTTLAIFIGCLGLFGLAAFATEQRTKEISIRKVLGASVSNITYLLSKNFLLLILMASVIAIPIAWWAASSWLNDFPYKINISPWYFILTVFTALLVALITISFQSIKAATSNPVKSLKVE